MLIEDKKYALLWLNRVLENSKSDEPKDGNEENDEDKGEENEEDEDEGEDEDEDEDDGNVDEWES